MKRLRTDRARCTAGRAGLAPVLALALVVGGCGSAGHPQPQSGATPAGTAAAVPWELPASQFGHQMLFRLRVDGPEGEGTLRLLLRLVSPSQFQLLVSDRLGRAVYGLETADGRSRLIDHQQLRVCPLGDSFVLEGVPFDPIPVASLPTLLLGRVPERPPGRLPEIPLDGEAGFDDLRGRRWTVAMAAGELVGWSLAEGGQPALWWRRNGRQNLLSDRVRGVQMTWEETLREPLGSAELAPLVVPAGYGQGDC